MSTVTCDCNVQRCFLHTCTVVKEEARQRSPRRWTPENILIHNAEPIAIAPRTTTLRGVLFRSLVVASLS